MAVLLESSEVFREQTTCSYCKEPATKGVIWADGRGRICVCDRHVADARKTVAGNDDEVDEIVPLEESSRVYEYTPLRRPAGHETVPPGYLGFRKSSLKFGVVQYPAPLSQADIKRYELAPLDPADPVNIRLVADAWRDQVYQDFARSDKYEVSDSGKTYILTYDPSGKAEFRITGFDGDVPTGHMEFSELEDAARSLFGFLSQSDRKRFITRVMSKNQRAE